LGVGRWALGVGRWALLGVGRWALGVGRWALGVKNLPAIFTVVKSYYP